MSDESGPAASETQRRTTLKPAEAEMGVVYTSIGNAKRVAGQYGPQLMLGVKTSAGKTYTVYLSEDKSGIAKGLLNGKLSLPVRIVRRETVRPAKNAKGEAQSTTGAEWALAPKA